MSEERNGGRFTPGNTIGEGTRFKPGNNISSKYNEKYCSDMIAYFMDEEVVFPTFEGYGIRIGVLAETLKNWTNTHPRFRDAHALCEQIQKERLIVGGLTRSFEPSFAKFIASNNHGMREKVEQEVKADTTLEVKINVVD